MVVPINSTAYRTPFVIATNRLYPFGQVCFKKKKTSEVFSDLDECETENSCSVNAVCTNTDGSYTCFCNFGYTGNGFECEGE